MPFNCRFRPCTTPLPLALQYALSRVQDRAPDMLEEALNLWEENMTVPSTSSGELTGQVWRFLEYGVHRRGEMVSIRG